MGAARGRGWRSGSAMPLAAAVAALVGAVIATTAVVSSRAADAAAMAGACAGDSGVTVVVDFGSLGGGTVTRCAPEPVSSGFEALTRAGFTYAGTARYPGLLCRIDGKPTPEQDPCQSAPSATYYWAYWTAVSPGGPWTYSDMGAGNRDPAPGSVEGWAFSDGCTRQPGGSCNTTTTATAAAPPTTRPSAGIGAPGVATTSVPGAVAGPAGPAGAVTTTSTTGAAAGGEVTSSTSTGVASDNSDANGDRTDQAGAPASDHGNDPGGITEGSGSPVGAVIGATAAAALGLGALVRQRRRTDHGGIDGPVAPEVG